MTTARTVGISASLADYIIDPSGILVTCFHVVDQKPEEAKTLAAVDYDGKIYPVREIIACNRAYDIAIVKIDGGKFPAVPLADHADVGTPAFTIGHPGRRFYTYTSASSHEVLNRTGKRDDPDDFNQFGIWPGIQRWACV